MIYMALPFLMMLNWLNGLRTTMEKNVIFVVAVDMLQSIGATHTLSQYSLRAQEATKKIPLGSDIEASIRASFRTVLPSIFVGNKKETTGGAYECLVSYIKDY